MAVRDLAFSDSGVPLLAPDELLVVESDAEKLLLQISDGRVVSTRYPKPDRPGRRAVSQPGDWIPLTTTRFGPLEVGEAMPYAVRGTTLTNRAVPRRTAPLTAVRVVSVCLDDITIDDEP